MSKITIFCSCENKRITTNGNINKTDKCKKCSKKINYDKLIELLNNLKVLTTKDEWNNTTMTKIEKIKIKCINDNCNEIRILPIKGINSDTKMCKICSIKKRSDIMNRKTINVNNNTFNPFHKYESDAFEIMQKLLKQNFIVKKTNDGCKCDMYIKPINNVDDKWIQIQLKSSKFVGRAYSFALHNNKYDNMLVILYHLIDKKMWIIDGNYLPLVNKLTIGKKESIYDKYVISDKNITQTIFSYFESTKLFSENEILQQLSKMYLVEHKHRVKRENKLKNILNFNYPKEDNMVYDVLINNYKVQDKAGRKKTKNGNEYFEFVVKKSKNNKKWYNKNDNDFYWFYNTDNSMILIIPESELLKHNYIVGNNKQEKLKSSFCVNFKNIANNKFSNFVFDYHSMDIVKLTELFK